LQGISQPRKHKQNGKKATLTCDDEDLLFSIDDDGSFAGPFDSFVGRMKKKQRRDRPGGKWLERHPCSTALVLLSQCYRNGSNAWSSDVQEALRPLGVRRNLPRLRYGYRSQYSAGLPKNSSKLTPSPPPTRTLRRGLNA